jgi:arabinofuranan 3-O-arabinosyltransferase
VRATPGTLAVADRLALGSAPVSSAPTTAAVSGSGQTGRRLSPATGADLVVERHNVNVGWQATQAGHRSARVVVDGWQQAWAVDGSGAPVLTRFAPETSYRLGLLGGAVALLLLVLVALVPRRRWPGVRARAVVSTVPGVVTQAGLGLLAGGLLAGWTGVALAALGVGSALGLRRAGSAGPWVAALPVLVASAAYAIRPWGDSDGWAGSLAWPSYLVVVAVAAALVLAADPSKWRLRRSAGTSTRRWSSSARGSEMSSVSPRIAGRCPPKSG